jgi:hypothetical protein
MKRPSFVRVFSYDGDSTKELESARKLDYKCPYFNQWSENTARFLNISAEIDTHLPYRTIIEIGKGLRIQ